MPTLAFHAPQATVHDPLPTAVQREFRIPVTLVDGITPRDAFAGVQHIVATKGACVEVDGQNLVVTGQGICGPVWNALLNADNTAIAFVDGVVPRPRRARRAAAAATCKPA